MKINYIAHACIHVEVGGINLLMDPWLVGPCWGGNLWLYPPPKIQPEDFSGLDFIYFSHAHDDHLHDQTLSRLSNQVKKARVIIPNFGARYFEKAVYANGFNNIQVMEHNEIYELAPNVKIEMLINDCGDHDSSVLLHTENITILFQTDNLMSVKEAERLGKKYEIDTVFTITSLTGIFPGFFDYKSDVMMRLTKEKSRRALNYSADIVRAIGAKKAVPYASDLCYLGELYFANQLHITNKQEFADLIKKRRLQTEVILMGPGDFLEYSSGQFRAQLNNHDFSYSNLAAYAVDMREQVERIKIHEHQYDHLSHKNDISILRDLLDKNADTWNLENFRVLWKVTGPDGHKEYFGQELPRLTENCNDHWKYDLRIEIPSHRLQRLVRGEYKMGFLTLQNGSIRCHRFSENLTDLEKKYWKWAMEKIKFFPQNK